MRRLHLRGHVNIRKRLLVHVCGVEESQLLEAYAAIDKTERVERADLVEQPPERALPPGPFELVAVFGLLHHVPGEAGRRALLEALARRVAPGGLLALAFWDFGAHARFAARRLPWSQAGAPRAPPIFAKPGVSTIPGQRHATATPWLAARPSQERLKCTMPALVDT